MQIPLKITMRHLRNSPALREMIATQAANLDREYARVIRCEVTVDGPAPHNSRDFEVRVHLRIPGHEFFTRSTDEDVYHAVRAAFDSARRTVHEFEDRRRRGKEPMLQSR